MTLVFLLVSSHNVVLSKTVDIFYLISCRYLRDDDDGVSEAIIEFAVQYVGILKVLLLFVSKYVLGNQCSYLCLTASIKSIRH